MVANDDLRDSIKGAECELQMLKDRLYQIERNCRHEGNWGPVTPDHIHHPGYHYAGDPVGTMGVDRRLPCDIPSRTEQRWKRTCQACGKIEYTSQTTDKVEKVPRF